VVSLGSLQVGGGVLTEIGFEKVLGLGQGDTEAPFPLDLQAQLAAAALQQMAAALVVSGEKMQMVARDEEHSVILTPFEVAVDGVQIPDRRYRYTWRSEVPTSHCRCTRTTMPQSA
jgi:hypothetical protein